MRWAPHGGSHIEQLEEVCLLIGVTCEIPFMQLHLKHVIKRKTDINNSHQFISNRTKQGPIIYQPHTYFNAKTLAAWIAPSLPPLLGFLMTNIHPNHPTTLFSQWMFLRTSLKGGTTHIIREVMVWSLKSSLQKSTTCYLLYISWIWRCLRQSFLLVSCINRSCAWADFLELFLCH